MIKKFFKWAGICLLAMIVLSVPFAFIGKDEVLKLTMEPIDLAKISDGTYIGRYDNYRWSNTVEVIVMKNEITKISPLKIQDGREKLVEDLLKDLKMK